MTRSGKDPWQVDLLASDPVTDYGDKDHERWKQATRTATADRRMCAYETIYRHDRRKHRHRCRCCNRILTEGEPVLMAKVANRATFAIHIECAASEHPCGTWRDAMNEWAKA